MARERKNPYEIEEEEKINPKKVYILACEGAQTEKKYFEGLSDEEEFFGIDANIKVQVLEKEDVTLSHPNHVIKELDRYKEKYDLEEDELCLIIDRDRKSFHEDQFDEIMKKCNDKKYSLYLSNPCFEFWLLLHLIEEELSDDEKIKLISNDKISPSVNYIDTKLTELIGFTYDKKINFDTYKLGVRKAIENSKNYEEELVKLKTTLGTNLQNLIGKIIS